MQIFFCTHKDRTGPNESIKVSSLNQELKSMLAAFTGLPAVLPTEPGPCGFSVQVELGITIPIYIYQCMPNTIYIYI